MIVSSRVPVLFFPPAVLTQVNIAVFLPARYQFQ